jgi:hypothetical protein
MAGEKKGKAYEALIHVALQELVDIGKLAGPVHWNVTPKGMSIEPDFMTGSDPDAPKTILLLSHCGSAKNSDMKTWRNLGELVEAKTVLPSIPRVYCILLGVMKADWETIQQHAIDQFVWVRQGTHSWANDLDTFITALVPSFPKGKDTQSDFMRNELKLTTDKTKVAYDQLKSLLETMHEVKSIALDKMWTVHRSRSIPPAPGARNTSLRRGMSKLLIFQDTSAVIDSALNDKLMTQSQAFYAEPLGLVRAITVNGTTSYKLIDKDITLAIKLLGVQSTTKIVANAPIPKIAAWLDQLRNKAQQDICCKWIEENYTITSSASDLLNTLQILHKDPTHFWPKNSSVNPPNMVWIIEYIFELIKLNSGNKNGYGYAQLAREASKLTGMPTAGDRVYSIVLSDWIRRNSNEKMPEEILKGITTAISQRIGLIQKSDYIQAALTLSDAFAQNLIEAKLCTYRGFDPLWDLINLNISGSKKIKVMTAFSEAAGQLKQAGQTSIAISKHTLINWQSCSDAGRDHKKKELCGRAIGLRYHWDGKAFVPRPGVKKIILVIDGTWRQTDLNSLLRAGWDEIYYPDEMDQLAKAIV